jgi:hypothetical protein
MYIDKIRFHEFTTATWRLDRLCTVSLISYVSGIYV